MGQEQIFDAGKISPAKYNIRKFPIILRTVVFCKIPCSFPCSQGIQPSTREAQPRSPHGAKRNAGMTEPLERPFPDFASLHPGYTGGQAPIRPMPIDPQGRILEAQY
jgi:hypothetical protein